MKRCILHLGHPKTGSTYLQLALHLNEAAFAAIGYWLPSDFSELGSHNFRQIAEAGKVFSGNLEPAFYAAERKDHAIVDKFLHHILHGSNLPNLILSSELYFYYIWEVRDIITRLNRNDFAVDVIVYLERQDRAAIATYVQNIRNHGTWAHIIDFLAQNRIEMICQYAKVLDEYCITPPNRIIARTFAPKFLSGNDLLKDFLEAARLPVDVHSLRRPGGRPNRGLPVEWYEMMRALNARGDRERVEQLNQAVPRVSQEAWTDPASYYFQQDVREYVLHRYMPNNERLIEVYLTDRSDDEKAYWRSAMEAKTGPRLDPHIMAECLTLLEEVPVRQGLG